jgi:hypothetical protein
MGTGVAGIPGDSPTGRAGDVKLDVVAGRGSLRGQPEKA